MWLRGIKLVSKYCLAGFLQILRQCIVKIFAGVNANVKKSDAVFLKTGWLSIAKMDARDAVFSENQTELLLP